MPSPRVVITGYAGLTALANTIDESWQALKSGRSGIESITLWDTQEHWEYNLGGQIKNYQPREMIDDRKLLKLISKQDILGLHAVKQLIQRTGLIEYRDALADATEFNDATGIVVASPGNQYQQQYDFMPLFAQANGDMKKFAQNLFSQVHPMWLLKILPNNVLAYTGIQYGFKGANENIVNHGVSGLQAIGEAYHYIRTQQIERAIVVGYEAPLEPQRQIYYAQLGVLTRDAVCPFDIEHSGTALAEGAGALLLESYEAAMERNAIIYGEILSIANTNEAQGVVSIREDGDGLMRALNLSLQYAQLKPNQIGMITAHGNANPQSDCSEAKAISQVFGNNSVPVTGFKWAIGHTLSASGVLESIFTLLALGEGKIPGITNLRQRAPECQQINVTPHEQVLRSPYGTVISRGLGSTNSCLVLTSELV